MTLFSDRNPKRPDAAHALRQQAEAIFAEQSLSETVSSLSSPTQGLSLQESLRLVHELQVHQIELELQNEELRRAQNELDVARARYFDLYELAPTGYCVITEKGIIEEANLTTATLLKVDRGLLIKQPISRFVVKEDQDTFYHNHRDILKSERARSFELRMLKSDGGFAWVHWSCLAIEDSVGNLQVRIGISDISDRKLIEAKLQSRNAFFEAIANSPLDGILVVDSEGKRIHQNARVQELWGIPTEIANHPDEAVQFQFICQKTKNPQAFSERVAYIAARPELTSRDETELVDGTILDRYTAPVRGENGSIYGRIWTFRDITEQKLAHRLQEEALNKLKMIASSIPGCVYQFRVRPDGTACMPYASDGLATMFQVHPDEVVHDASAVFQRIHPDDLDGVQTAIQTSLKELTPFCLDFRLRYPDNSIRWITANSLPEREADGSTLWHGYVGDVTSTHETAIELHEAKIRLEEAQSIARMGNWSFDVATSESHWSKQLYGIFGFDDANGEPTFEEIRRAFHPDDVGYLDRSLEAAISDGKPFSVVYRIIRPDAEVRFVRSKGRARRDSNGKVLSLYGTSMDVTDEMERERALQVARNQADAANRAKSEFLANMSHEIRTPLTAILGFADMLREEGHTDDLTNHRLHAINTIANAGQHLLTIINDILDLSKIEAEKTTMEVVETPLVNVLREVKRMLRPKAYGKGVTLDLKLRTAIPEWILSDATRLRQILMNLVGNAAKFTDKGAIVINASVDATSGNSTLVIDIEDTGPGITNEQSQMLFHAFEQADNTLRRKYGGTGLGLAISRRLAKLMGGDVSLLRTEVGRGSCFRLTLPLHPVANTKLIDHLEPLMITAVNAAPQKVSIQGRILLAEDGLDNQRLISFILKKAGATVDTADDGQIAIEMLDKAIVAGLPYDLLLTDIQMPRIDGYMLVRTLRASGMSLPIIALTAHALAEDRQKCMDAGCDDYLSKPIDRETLLAQCAKWIATGRHGQTKEPS